MSANKFSDRDLRQLDRADNAVAVEDGRFAKAAPEPNQGAPARGFVAAVVGEVVRMVGQAPADRESLAVFRDDATGESSSLRQRERAARNGALLEPVSARYMLSALNRAISGRASDDAILEELRAYLRGRGKAQL